MFSELNKFPAIPFAVALAIVLLIAAFFMPPKLNKEAYLMSFFDKQVLLKQRASPRIIFIGGSNVAFGIDSSLVKRTLHKNVINDGTQMGFGLSFMLNSVKKYLLADDVIVIIPEYEYFFCQACVDRSVAGLLSVRPNIISSVPFDQLGQLLLSVRSRLYHKCIFILNKLARKILLINESSESLKKPLWRREAFNADGDIANFLDKPCIPQNGFWLPIYINQPGSYDPTAIKIINEFARSVTPRGIKVFFCFPYINTSFYSACKPALEELNVKLLSQLEVPSLGNVNTCVWPDEYFYDSRYHLLTCYKQLRTKLMLSELNHFSI